MSKRSARGAKTLQRGIVPAGKNRLQRELDELARQNPAVAKASAEVDRVTDEIIARRRAHTHPEWSERQWTTFHMLRSTGIPIADAEAITGDQPVDNRCPEWPECGDDEGPCQGCADYARSLSPQPNQGNG